MIITSFVNGCFAIDSILKQKASKLPLRSELLTIGIRPCSSLIPSTCFAVLSSQLFYIKPSNPSSPINQNYQ